MWALALLLLLIGLLVVLVALALRHTWIRMLVLPGWPTRERVVENCKLGLLWLTLGALSLMIWLQATSLFPLDLRSAIVNGVFWGSVLTIIVSVASARRVRKSRRRADWVREAPKKGRHQAWLMLGVLLFGTWIPLIGLGSSGFAFRSSTQILERQLEFSVVIGDIPLVRSWAFSVMCEYSDFRTGAPWDDDIRVDIEVRTSSGDLVAADQLDLSIIAGGFWMIVPIPTRQYNFLYIPALAPGLFLFNLTSTFDKPIRTTVTQIGQPLQDLLFMIGAMGTILFIIGACYLRRRDRVSAPAYQRRPPGPTPTSSCPLT